MRLNTKPQSLDQKLWEFDFWVTPSIVDIRATDRFQLEMKRIIGVLETLSNGARRELDITRFAASLVDRVISHLDQFTQANDPKLLSEFVEEFLASLSALLFLVTGKSDNNNKCQFPLYLRNQIGWETIATLRSKKGRVFASEESIPRILDSESYMARIARMYVAEKQSNCDSSLLGITPKLLFPFVDSLLADELSRNQLTTYLRHYRICKKAGEDATAFLTPLVMFQVRGSVAASGGHEPEKILRQRMSDWGMIRDVDFNINDVVLDVAAGQISESRGDMGEEQARKAKTRAYDFVLPFRTPTWHPRIFIQSQFYAGDSGSVSHKNVDQTSSSRQSATKLAAKAWPKSAAPVFLEYLDGAGYSASLNGDLKSLLSFQDTSGFFQIRSAPIRLRRELQKIGFLTPLEIGHAVLRRLGSQSSVSKHLLDDGYSSTEIARAILVAQQYAFIVVEKKRLVIAAAFLPAVRRHLLLDLIACEGGEFASLNGVAGVVLVPGYGPHHGLAVSKLEALVRKSFASVWPAGFLADLQFLCDHGWVVLR